MASVDRAAVDLRARAVSELLSSHAGGLEVVSFEDGVVRVEFTGLCTACWMRPVTMLNIIEPAFLDMDGVDAVEVLGARYSRQARERWAKALPVANPRNSNLGEGHGDIGPSSPAESRCAAS